VLPTDEIILVDTTAGDVTITLPLPGSLTVRNNFTIKKISVDINVVNVVQANNVDGANPYIIVQVNKAVTPAYDTLTSTWWII